MIPEKMKQVIEGLRYDTERSTLLCGDDWWDGHNWERGARQRFLYRTKNGRYFLTVLTRWQGETSHIEPVDTDTAVEFFEACRIHDQNKVDFETAFPGIEIKEA